MVTNSDIFLESIIHAQHSVYGFKLKPLSLFHLSLIERFCPTVLSGSEITREELKKASAICACRDLKDFLNINRLSVKGYLSIFYNYEKELIKFERYISDHMTLPESNEQTGEEKNNPFPFALMFAGKLIKDTGYKWDYVFYDMSISQIFWLVSVVGYIESGETGIISDKEKSIMEFHGCPVNSIVSYC